MNCDMKQSEFIRDIGQHEYHVNGKKFNATSILYNVSNQDTCKIFENCVKNPFFQLLEATKNKSGFFKFIGEGSVTKIPDDEKDLSCKLKRPIRSQVQLH